MLTLLLAMLLGTQVELVAKHGLGAMSYEEAFGSRSRMWGDFMCRGEDRGLGTLLL